jgi:LysM repeat protein
LFSREEEQVLMRRNQRIWQYLKQHRIVSIVAGQLAVILVLGSVLLGTTLGSSVLRAFAQAPCAKGDQVYSVASGDSLGTIAAQYNTSWQKLASYNHIANANMIYVNDHICIPNNVAKATGTPIVLGPQMALTGSTNTFPYGQCTWWADQRYFQLHGVYVPWQTNANAWQWSSRASDYNWSVSTVPVVGSIVVLQPGVQGAYSLGHVGVVESLSNGSAVVSNMNWGGSLDQVTDSQVQPGPGVSFISL